MGDVEAPQPLEGMAEAEGLGPAACAAAGALDALFADQFAHSAEGAKPAACHPPRGAGVKADAVAEFLPGACCVRGC